MDDFISRRFLLAEYDRVHIGEPGKARKLIVEAPAVQGWIPVSERLPELDVDVLAFNGDYIFVSQYYISHFGSWDKQGHLAWVKEQYAKNPTHWMPLPEPPKEGE